MSDALSAAGSLRMAGFAAALILSAHSTIARAQISPSQTTLIQNAIGTRVEALTILGGDFGLSDGNFHSSGGLLPGAGGDMDTRVSKLGGDGDVGDPEPLGDLNVG